MYNDFLLSFKTKILDSLNVCLPGIIESWDFQTQKAIIKIDSKRIEDNNEAIEYPVISGVPIITPSSGGAFISMPIKRGDSCLVLFTDKDITNWLLGSSNQIPNTKRMHSLSDAVAIMGLNQFTKPLPIQNNNDLSISYSNSVISIKPNGNIEINSKKDINIVCDNATIDCKDINLNSSSALNINTQNMNVEGSFNLKGDLHLDGNAFGKNNQSFKVGTKLEVTGDVEATGDMEATGDVKAGSVSLKNHTHSYIKPIVGSSPTGATPAQTGGAT